MAHSSSFRNQPVGLRFLRGWAAAVLGLASGGLVRADLSMPAGRTGGADGSGKGKAAQSAERAASIPTPKGGTAKVMRGKTVEIPLKAVTGSNQPVEFRLGEEPKFGRLEGPFPSLLFKDQGVVRYTATPGETSEVDSFTFRCRHKDTPVSGSATIRISIGDEKPELTVETPRLDFGTVILGETRALELTVLNAGSAPSSQVLALPAPWGLVGGQSTLMAAAGGRGGISISFTPTKVGLATYEVPLADARGGSVYLTAMGGLPFSVNSGWVEMAWSPENRARTGGLQLENKSQEPLTVTLSTDKRLNLATRELKLAGRETAQVRFFLPLPDRDELRTFLTIRSATASEDIRIVAPAPPPHLELKHAVGALEKDGRVSIPANSRITLVFENVGGRSAELSTEVPRGFVQNGRVPSLVVEAGAEVRVPLEVSPFIALKPAGNLIVRFGSQQLVIPVDGELSTMSATAESPGAPATTPSPLLTQRTDTATADPADGSTGRALSHDDELRQIYVSISGILRTNAKLDPGIPVITGSLSFRDMHATGFTVGWKPVGEGLDYRVFAEQPGVDPVTHMPLRYWVDTKAKIARAGDLVEATISHWPQGQRCVIRLLTLSADGTLRSDLTPQVVVPLPVDVHRGLWWKILLGLFVFTGLVWLSWRWWQQRDWV